MSAKNVLDNFKVLVNRSGYIREMDLGPQNADAILSALSAAGYAVVPVEPTEEMLRSGWRESGQQHSVTAIYKAMLTAAKESK